MPDPAQPRTDAARNAEIVLAAKGGATHAELASRHGISVGRIYQILAAAAGPKRSSTGTRYARIVALHREGHSAEALAAYFRCSVSSINRILRTGTAGAELAEPDPTADRPLPPVPGPPLATEVLEILIQLMAGLPDDASVGQLRAQALRLQSGVQPPA
jgi:Mor family transcriptional regulator